MRISRNFSLPLVAILFAVVLFTPSLGWACGENLRQFLLTHSSNMNYIGAAQGYTAAASSTGLPMNPREPIVGGWEMMFSVGGTTVDYIFEQFHSDGTEIENDITDVLSGNVCLGVWEKLSDGTYGVTHPSFNYFGYDTHPGDVLFLNPATPPNTGLAGQSDGTLGVLFFRLTVSKDGQTLSGKVNYELCSPLDFFEATCTAPVTLDVSGKRITVNISQLPD